MVAIFAKYGIRLPRQKRGAVRGGADQERTSRSLPGDLVFSEGVHPGHVGLYVGNGNVLEDPHTGDHVKVIPLKNFGWNGESARWWAQKAKHTPKGGGGSSDSGQMPAGWDKQVAAAQAAASSSKSGKGVSKSTIIGIEAQIAAELRDLPKDLDAVEKAAIAHIKKLRADLHVGMSQAELGKDRAALARWGKVLRDEIKKNADAAKRAAQKHARRSRPPRKRPRKRGLTAGQPTSRSLNARSASSGAKSSGNSMSKPGSDCSNSLVAQTPEEQALADYQAKLQAEQSAQTHAQLQSDLAAAIASGDPAQIKAGAGRDQPAARARPARSAAEGRRRQPRRRRRRKGATQQQQDEYQQQRDDQWQALQDQHDDQVAMFDADLKLWQTWRCTRSRRRGRNSCTG
jgi:hypothetical protein